MESMTQMEVLLCSELLRTEEIAVKKAQCYSDTCEDPELKRLFGSFADAHRQKIQGLLSKIEAFGQGTGGDLQ